MLHAFTVDVEDYYHVSAFETQVERSQWSHYESRVARSTQRILDLLDEHQTRATFFVLGWVAKHVPQLVKEIASRGHEIGSHSYWHRLIYRLTPEQFRADVCRSRDVLEDLIGKPVVMYRAPSFSITKKSLWALEILVEEGFSADSSIFPTHHDRYGIPDAKRHIHTIDTPAGPLLEFPPSVFRVGRVNIPISGGGYFRAEPWPIYKRLARRCVKRTEHPLMFYIHPWEVDPEQPRMHHSSIATRFRHYVNLRHTEDKLKQLLESFRFAPMGNVLQNVEKSNSRLLTSNS